MAVRLDASDGAFRAQAPIMLRASVLPVDGIAELMATNIDQIISCRRDGDLFPYAALGLTEDQAMLFEEAIRFASRSLYGAIRKYASVQPKRAWETVASAIRYLVRMKTRPTPFGLFSGVCVLSLGDTTDVVMGRAREHRHSSRIDMRVLTQIGRKVEAQDAEHFSLYLNPTLLKYASRVHFQQFSYEGAQNAIRFGNVRVSSVVDELIVFLQGRVVPFQEVVSHLEGLRPGSAQDKITAFLKNLVTVGLLLTNVRPTLLGEPLDELIQVASRAPGHQANLGNLATALVQYDACPIGEGGDQLAILDGLIETMVDRLGGDSPLLQVDLALACEGTKIAESLTADAAKAAEILFQLGVATPRSYLLEAYAKEFGERFGEAAEVPILVLLDEHLGLGAPPTYTNPPHPTRSWTAPEPRLDFRDVKLVNLATQAIVNGSNMIELTDDMIAQLTEHEDWREQLPPTAEIFVSIVASSPDALRTGDYQVVVGASGTEHPAGRGFGRFVRVLPDAVRHDLRRLHTRTTNADDFIVAELTYDPLTPSAMNVAIRPNIVDYSIAVGVTPDQSLTQIPLQDIVVGLDQGKFYLRSRTLGKRIIIHEFHKVNTNAASNVVRFMIEIGRQVVYAQPVFDWRTANLLHHLPRVSYRNIVLSPERWSIRSDIIEEIGRGDLPGGLRAFVDEHRVKRYVYIADVDNRIMVDTCSDLGRQTILRELKKDTNGQLFLLEALPGPSDGWLMGPDGERYLGELLVPLERVPEPARAPARISRQPMTGTSEQNHQGFPLGSEWLYGKVYANSSLHKALIMRLFDDVVQPAATAGLIDKWFFIRFADPQSHIRLRLHVASLEDWTPAMKIMVDACNNMVDEGLATRILFDTYEPEYLRYGGADILPIVEKIFSVDSFYVVEKLRSGEEASETKGMSMALSLVRLAKDLGYRGSAAARLFALAAEDDPDARTSKYPAAALYPQEQLKQWGSMIADASSAPGESEVIREWLNWRSEEIERLVSSIGNRLDDEQWSELRDHLSISLLHMHFNRASGIDRDEELKMYASISKALRWIGRGATATKPQSLGITPYGQHGQHGA